MFEYSFEALGTKWTLLSDRKNFSEEFKESLQIKIASFEERFSRFRDASEVNQFRESKKGVYRVSVELAELLGRAQDLKMLTEGRYDPAGGVILEHMGYDQKYSFIEKKGDAPIIPNWSIKERELSLHGPTAFDLGGIGKGYAIDFVASLLHAAGYQYYLIDGGGDMYATCKADGSPYTIALEWPGKPELAYGTVELSHQGLAVSDITTRRFGVHHHIVDAAHGTNTSAVKGCVALGKTAWDADSATAALVQWPNIDVRRVEEKFGVETVIITEKEEFLVSPKWSGEIFNTD
jgi:FAD:protein FMN transferase